MVEEFKYLGTILTDQNSIEEEIKSRLKSGNASVFQFSIKKCKYYDIQNYNSESCFYGCGTWSLTLREGRRLRVFENRVLRIKFGSRRDEVRGGGENYVMRSLMICTAHRILFG